MLSEARRELKRLDDLELYKAKANLKRVQVTEEDSDDEDNTTIPKNNDTNIAKDQSEWWEEIKDNPYKED